MTKPINKKFQPNNLSVAELEKQLNKFFTFRNNVVLNEIQVKYPGKEDFEPINENSIYRFLHKKKIYVSMNKLRIILGSDFVPNYNPITDYFREIKDLYNEKKHSDYIKRFSNYLESLDNELLEVALKHWMVSSVKCIHDQSYFNKTILVFYNGLQNSGKSSLARFIVPPSLSDYFVENSLEGKDGLITLATSAFHLLDEMVSVERMMNQEFKSIISKVKVDVRAPYEKNRVSRPRITNFIGTSDRQGFLTEDVGTARFIVIEVPKINFSYRNKIDPDTLWSHAQFLAENGEYHHLSEDIKRRIAENNRKYINSSVLGEYIIEIILPSDKSNPNAMFLQTKEIIELLQNSKNIKVPGDRKIGETLGNLGFVRESRYDSVRKHSTYGYFVQLVSTRK